MFSWRNKTNICILVLENSTSSGALFPTTDDFVNIREVTNVFIIMTGQKCILIPLLERSFTPIFQVKVMEQISSKPTDTVRTITARYLPKVLHSDDDDDEPHYLFVIERFI